MKKIFVFIPLALLLSTSAYADDAPWMHTVSVTGEAEAKIAPDEATVSVNVYNEDRELVAAKSANDKKVKMLLALAHEAGIKEDNIKTLYANVQPVYDYANNKPVFRTYAVSNQVEVKLTRLDTLGNFMNTLVQNGFDRINNVNFGLADERKAREEMLVRAIANAQAKAAKMAAAVGRALGMAVYVSDTGGSVSAPPYPMMGRGMAMMKAQAMAAPMEDAQMPAGLITVQQNVSVVFELK